MNVRVRMYQVLLFKFGRHLCKGSMVYIYKTMLCHTGGKRKTPLIGLIHGKSCIYFHGQTIESNND